ncbi:hypothetical protein [Streptomyces albogriseolus]
MHVVFQDARHAEWTLWQHAMYAEVEAPQWLRTSLHRREVERGPARLPFVRVRVLRRGRVTPRYRHRRL